MKSIILTCILVIIGVCNANLYGTWQSADTAMFGQISTVDGSLTMKLEFPNYLPYQGLAAENNMTQVYTFVLSYPGDTLYLVSVNVAKNKVIYFVPIPSGLYPEGLKYDSDLNSLKATIAQGNDTWLVTEMDPASASYDVYLQVSGIFLSAGLSTYNHTYYVAFQNTDQSGVKLYNFDTIAGKLTNTVDLTFPEGVLEGPLDIIYVSELDLVLGTFLMKDSSHNVGQDYAVIDTETGIVKPLGIYQPSQQASIVSQAAHENFIYAVVNINGALQLVTVDLDQQSQVSEIAENSLLSSMGYFIGL